MALRPGGQYRTVLRHRDFRRLLVSYIVDASGGWAYSVVLSIYVVDRTGSTEWLAAVTASRWITGLVVGGYAGVLADRYERTRVMTLSATASATVMAGITVVVASDGPLPLLLALSAVAAAVGAPYGPAAGALRPDIVPESELASSNALFSLVENLVVVIGPALGGLLLLTGKAYLATAVNTASFAVAVVVGRRLGVRSTGEADADSGTLEMLRDGLAVIVRQRVAFVLMLYGALAGAIYATSTVVFVPLSGRFGLGHSGYTYLIATSSLGSVLAAGLANRLGARRRLAPVIVVAIAVEALPFLASIWVHTSVVGLLLQIVSGTGFIVVDLLSLVAVQRDLPREVLSRGLAVWDVIVLLATLVASFGTATLLAHAGLAATLSVIGIVFPALALLGLPALLRADRESAAAAERLRPRVELLEALDLFTGIDRPALERLADVAEPIELTAGHVLIKQGDPADALWLLGTGSLAVAARVDRRKRALPDVTAPGYVGELGLLHHTARTATVTTREPVQLLKIGAADFVEALESSPASASMLSLAGVRLRRTSPQAVRAPTLGSTQHDSGDGEA